MTEIRGTGLSTLYEVLKQLIKKDISIESIEIDELELEVKEYRGIKFIVIHNIEERDLDTEGKILPSIKKDIEKSEEYIMNKPTADTLPRYLVSLLNNKRIYLLTYSTYDEKTVHQYIHEINKWYNNITIQ